MDVAQGLIYITSSYIYSKLLIMTIFKLIMPIKSSFLLKHLVSCNFMLKYCITVSLRQFKKTLNDAFYLSRPNKNLETCMPA